MYTSRIEQGLATTFVVKTRDINVHIETKQWRAMMMATGGLTVNNL